MILTDSLLACFFPGKEVSQPHPTQDTRFRKETTKASKQQDTPPTPNCPDVSLQFSLLAAWRDVQRYFQRCTMMLSYCGGDTEHVFILLQSSRGTPAHNPRVPPLVQIFPEFS